MSDTADDDRILVARLRAYLADGVRVRDLLSTGLYIEPLLRVLEATERARDEAEARARRIAAEERERCIEACQEQLRRHVDRAGRLADSDPERAMSHRSGAIGCEACVAAILALGTAEPEPAAPALHREPLPHAEASARVLAELEDPAAMRASLVRAGILTEDGRLTERYAPEPPRRRSVSDPLVDLAPDEEEEDEET